MGLVVFAASYAEPKTCLSVPKERTASTGPRQVDLHRLLVIQPQQHLEQTRKMHVLLWLMPVVKKDQSLSREEEKWNCLHFSPLP